MRGPEQPQAALFSYLSVEDRIPQDHPLRAMRNEAYASMLAGSPDSQYVRLMLEPYQRMADSFPPALRARASETIADLWVRVRRYDRARSLYQWLLATPQAGVDTSSVRRPLRVLPRERGPA